MDVLFENLPFVCKNVFLLWISLFPQCLSSLFLQFFNWHFRVVLSAFRTFNASFVWLLSKPSETSITAKDITTYAARKLCFRDLISLTNFFSILITDITMNSILYQLRNSKLCFTLMAFLNSLWFFRNQLMSNLIKLFMLMTLKSTAAWWPFIILQIKEPIFRFDGRLKIHKKLIFKHNNKIY